MLLHGINKIMYVFKELVQILEFLDVIDIRKHFKRTCKMVIVHDEPFEPDRGQRGREKLREKERERGGLVWKLIY